MSENLEQDAPETNPVSESQYPMWLWGLAGMAFLWNLMGLAVFIAQATLPIDSLATTDAEREFLENYPTWALIAFGAATTGGTLGSLLLLLKSRWATPLFVLSLVGVLVQQFYMFFVSDLMEKIPDTSYVMPLCILVIAGLLLGLSVMANRRSWLR